MELKKKSENGDGVTSGEDETKYKTIDEYRAEDSYFQNNGMLNSYVYTDDFTENNVRGGSIPDSSINISNVFDASVKRTRRVRNGYSNVYAQSTMEDLSDICNASNSFSNSYESVAENNSNSNISNDYSNSYEPLNLSRMVV